MLYELRSQITKFLYPKPIPGGVNIIWLDAELQEKKYGMLEWFYLEILLKVTTKEYREMCACLICDKKSSILYFPCKKSKWWK